MVQVAIKIARRLLVDFIFWRSTHLGHGFKMLVNGFYARRLSICRGGRLFNVIDNFNRQGLTIATELSLPAVRVICSLKQII